MAAAFFARLLPEFKQRMLGSEGRVDNTKLDTCEYTGEILNGLPHGTGTLKCDGVQYSGPFKSGLPHGPEGEWFDLSGNYYKGPFVCGHKRGKGYGVQFKNNKRLEYEGYFGKNGEPDTLAEAPYAKSVLKVFEPDELWQDSEPVGPVVYKNLVSYVGWSTAPNGIIGTKIVGDRHVRGLLSNGEPDGYVRVSNDGGKTWKKWVRYTHGEPDGDDGGSSDTEPDDKSGSRDTEPEDKNSGSKPILYVKHAAGRPRIRRGGNGDFRPQIKRTRLS